MLFCSFTSTLRLKRHSQLTQSPLSNMLFICFLIFFVMTNFRSSSCNSYFDILAMSKSLLSSKVFNLEVCYKICYPCGSKDYSSRTLRKFRLVRNSAAILNLSRNEKCCLFLNRNSYSDFRLILDPYSVLRTTALGLLKFFYFSELQPSS